MKLHLHFSLDADNDVYQRRQSKYILGAIEALEGAPLPTGEGVWGGGTAPSPEFFLIFDFKMAICGAFLVQFFAVQLKL